MSQPFRLSVALTLDVDPDANRAVPGRVDAVSAGTDAPSCDACLRGLARVVPDLESHGLPATLFWDGQTLLDCAARRPELVARMKANPALEHACHGYAHEDFAGVDSGLPLDADATLDAVRQGARAVTETMGRRPRSFRAPYCRLTAPLRAALSTLGYRSDATLTQSMDELAPQPLAGAPGVWELPLARARDAGSSAISTYLWQMFERRRPPSDYVEMLASARNAGVPGLIQIALHPWHMYVDAEGAAQPAQAAQDWREFLARTVALDGLRFTTVDDYCASTIQDR
jgi:peptidoglycan/xylan/chitin deacetylase (PgdA/CDA1 family)